MLFFQPLSIGLDALYGPLIPHILLVLVHLMVMSKYQGIIKLKPLCPGE